jgi:uncharacterized protein YgbK (DUF1537 family)
MSSKNFKVVVLDDDPTGNQTVSQVPILTVWDLESLEAELKGPDPLFFLICNTRSLAEQAARDLMKVICQNLNQTARNLNLDLEIIIRGDSTLRGHFPSEMEGVETGLGKKFDAWLILPFFREGGRLTIDEVHYLQENGHLTPVGETPFAKDPALGYRSSNLREWVEEKTKGGIKATEVIHLRKADLQSPALLSTLLSLQNGQVVTADAEKLADLLPLAQAWLEAKGQGKKILARSAASWVQVVLDLLRGFPSPAYQPKQVESEMGGLIVAGSFVPKTTAQLDFLQKNKPDLLCLEWSIEDLLENGEAIETQQKNLENALLAGQDVLVYTSRTLKTLGSAAENLELGHRIAEALSLRIGSLKVRPRFLIAKGGNTSYDLATRGLGVRRCKVLGQVIRGVPVWELGPESRFPGMEYVVFPGNVGGENAILEVLDFFDIR